MSLVFIRRICVCSKQVLDIRIQFSLISTLIFCIFQKNLFIYFSKYFSYHATAALEEAQKLARQKIPSAAALQLHSFTFDDFGLENDEMLQVKNKTKKSFAVHPLQTVGLFSPDYVGGCTRARRMMPHSAL